MDPITTDRALTAELLENRYAMLSADEFSIDQGIEPDIQSLFHALCFLGRRALGNLVERHVDDAPSIKEPASLQAQAFPFDSQLLENLRDPFLVQGKEIGLESALPKSP